MSERISLTRVIALNWYGFRQIFDVEDNVLISGAFGTGKSALLDLLQYVLLGEHWRANRAAAGNARGRDLVGYCLGDTNQTRNGQRHFLRSSGVTLVALEFTRHPEKNRPALTRETWGIRLEYSGAEAAPKQTYFYIPDRVDYSGLAPDGKNLLADDAFRTWLRRDYGNESLFARQGDYLEEMAAPRHLNFDTAAFRRTFPKAIAFEPEENIEKFIREFILEESPLDVRDVRTALRAYDDTRRRLEKQEDEAAFLRRIAEQHALYEASSREEAILEHTAQALKLLQAEERRDDHTAQLLRLEKEQEQTLRELDRVGADADGIGKLLGEVRSEIHKDPAQVEFTRLNADERELQSRVNALQAAQKSARQQYDERHVRWLSWLRHGANLQFEGLQRILVVDDAPLARLRSGTDAERPVALQHLAQRFNELWVAIEGLAQPLKGEIASAEKRLRQLTEDLENLSKGHAPGSFPLFSALRSKLGIRVEQLGRLIEVKPEAERWWPALELFLGRNRWALVVNEPADYREALDTLRKTAPGREPEALLNPFEIRQLRGNPRENSLLTKVDILHPVARAYAENLLGDVQCVESVEELEMCDAPNAITPDGILKQTPQRLRLRPATPVELTLGREGLERMRAVKQREQNETQRLHDALKQRLTDVQMWLDQGRKGGLADATLPDCAAELPQLPALEARLSRVRETISLLRTPEWEARQKQLIELEERKTRLDREVGRLLKTKEEFGLRVKPLREAVEAALEEIQSTRLAVETSRVDLSRRFSELLNSTLAAECDRLRNEFPKWPECFAAVQLRAKTASVAAAEARERRRSEREKLTTARDEQGNLRHPEYQREFAAEDEDNGAWAARLRVLETIELDTSRELAAARKQDWERRLEETVLNELNRRIENAQNTIRLLDRYLSQPIGRFRYRISQKKDTAGYGAAWQLLNSGFEPTDPLTAGIADPEVQRAKEEMMRAVDSTDPSDARACRLLDYRNYHHYDLEMVPADKPDAPPISLGRSGRNLSGGENQAPYFISMLAAFRRVYDRGDRNATRSQQLGLVVMDEAFSKLSGDGIEDCLALARSFQLQLIMAFPPERLGVMVPHAQTVIMCQKETERDDNGYVTRIENLPLLTTMAEAMDALS